MNYIDTHAHLSREAYGDEVDIIIKQAKEAHVSKILMPDVGSEGRDELMTLCAKYPDYLYPMVGLHPTTINDLNGKWQSEVDEVERLLRDNPNQYRAIGEIGLDLYWSKEFKTEQQLAFEALCELAIQHNLPINVHTRDASKEMITTLEQFRGRGLYGAMHAFCDTIESFRHISTCGDFLFSIGGVVTFKKSQVAQVVEEIPLDLLLLETDAPWLTPTPYRGRRNEPAYISYTCAKIAEIKGIDPTIVANITTQNAIKLFNLPT